MGCGCGGGSNRYQGGSDQKTAAGTRQAVTPQPASGLPKVWAGPQPPRERPEAEVTTQ